MLAGLVQVGCLKLMIPAILAGVFLTMIVVINIRVAGGLMFHYLEDTAFGNGSVGVDQTLAALVVGSHYWSHCDRGSTMLVLEQDRMCARPSLRGRFMVRGTGAMQMHQSVRISDF